MFVMALFLLIGGSSGSPHAARNKAVMRMARRVGLNISLVGVEKLIHVVAWATRGIVAERGMDVKWAEVGPVAGLRSAAGAIVVDRGAVGAR